MITDTLRTLRVAAPTQKREEPVSGAVDEHLLASLVRQGLKREQLVTDVQSLQPRDEAIARLQKLGWKAHYSEHFMTLSIAVPAKGRGPFPRGQSVTFLNQSDVAYRAEFDTSITSCANGAEEQIVAMDKNGKVTYNYWRAT